MPTPLDAEPDAPGADGRPGHEDLGAVYIHGAMHRLPRAALSARMVNGSARLVRVPARADTVVLARAAVARCLEDVPTGLPFTRPAHARLLSEAAFRSRLEPSSRRAEFESGGYAPADVARLSGLPPATVEVLTAADVLGGGAESYGYPDLAEARQVATLLGRGHGLPAVVAAAGRLGARGLRLAQVRFTEAPWGELVQQVGASGLTRLDGQISLGLDEERDPPDGLTEGLASEDAGAVLEAERWYRRAAQADRRDPLPLFNLGNLLGRLGRDGEAAMALQQALTRDPNFVEAAFNLAGLHEKGGDPERAIRILAATLTRHPLYAQASYNLARLLTLQGRFAEALRVWEDFIALAPDDPDAPHARRAALLCRLEMRRTPPGRRR